MERRRRIKEKKKKKKRKEKEREKRKRRKRRKRKRGSGEKRFPDLTRKYKESAREIGEWQFNLSFCFKILFDLKLSLSIKNRGLIARSRLNYDVYK